jgi:hypothetical protein
MSGEKYIGLDVHQATISVAVMDFRWRLRGRSGMTFPGLAGRRAPVSREPNVRIESRRSFFGSKAFPFPGRGCSTFAVAIHNPTARLTAFSARL